jgi:hypothetical protein
VLVKAAVFVTLMCVPGNIGQEGAQCADDPRGERDECKNNKDNCSGYPSRTVAYLQAMEYAGVDKNWKPVGWDQFNKPSTVVDQILYRELRQRAGTDPYGYRGPRGAEVVEHPADGDHDCPHFHAKRNLSESSIKFPYYPKKP